MARTDLSTLKTKFETGDKPNQQDYVDLIDTLVQQSTDLGTSGNNEHVINGIENQTVVDQFVASDWRMIKYLVSVSKVAVGINKFYATELTILIDNINLNVSEYGIIDNDGDIGTVSVSRNGSNIQLVFTPNPAITPVTVRYARMGLKA
jgi:tRNA G26 N,N-dimethylase Trm1